jgi:imidazoleglycerol-phosphate dehydratase
VERITAESHVFVRVDLGPRSPKLKEGISAGAQFLGHMVETIAWRACMNVEVSLEMREYRLNHVVSEDIGLAFGEALGELVRRNMPRGINGNGSAICGIDEALSRVFLSFEDRSVFCFSSGPVEVSEHVEDMLSSDLRAFLGGLSQGARATLHVDLLKGEDPHHCWESAFRALGEAIRASFSPCQWRKGATPGVKGTVSVRKRAGS